MAVSPAGDVFVLPAIQSSDTSLYVAKLGAEGSKIAWKASAGFLPPASLTAVLAVDSQGRTYVSAPTSNASVYDTGSLVARLNAAGSAVDWTTTVTGWPTSIAADGSGAVVVAGSLPGSGTPTVYVTRLAPDGSSGYYASLSQETSPALALDASGNAVVFTSSSGLGVLRRLSSTGAVIASTSVLANNLGNWSAMGLDAAGNAYVLGTTGQLYPVRNNIATCLPSASLGSQNGTRPVVQGTVPILVVVAADGSISQSTYLPGAAVSDANPTPLLATGPNSTVFVATTSAAGFAPTQQGPFQQAPGGTFLLRLAPHAAAQTVPLACVGNAATYFTVPVAPGEIVALMGSGLGPAQGIQTQLTPESPYPVQVSGVKVTFDGTPAPLLWVQDSQINAVVPWSLTPGSNTKICVSWSGASTNCLTWPVAQTAPGVFSVDGHYACALNQDGTINSATNPATPGSIVAVWATGLGPIQPAQADGAEVVTPLPANVLQADVEAWWLSLVPPFMNSLVSRSVPVTYSGPAPYLVSGTSQVNFQIPSAVPYYAKFYLALPATSPTASPDGTNRSQDFSIYVAGQ